jgi:hypothetical protein
MHGCPGRKIINDSGLGRPLFPENPVASPRNRSLFSGPWKSAFNSANRARGQVMAICRPNSLSNREGSNSGSRTRCNSHPCAISSHAAATPMLPGFATRSQPRTSWKNAADLSTSRVASVMCASANFAYLARLSRQLSSRQGITSKPATFMKRPLDRSGFSSRMRIVSRWLPAGSPSLRHSNGRFRSGAYWSTRPTVLPSR